MRAPDGQVERVSEGCLRATQQGRHRAPSPVHLTSIPSTVWMDSSSEHGRPHTPPTEQRARSLDVEVLLAASAAPLVSAVTIPEQIHLSYTAPRIELGTPEFVCVCSGPAAQCSRRHRSIRYWAPGGFDLDGAGPPPVEHGTSGPPLSIQSPHDSSWSMRAWCPCCAAAKWHGGCGGLPRTCDPLPGRHQALALENRVTLRSPDLRLVSAASCSGGSRQFVRQARKFHSDGHGTIL
jgi:hypothetical protein